MMRGLIAQDAGVGGGNSCTSTGDWYGPGAITSGPQTITVPGGNPGTLKFNVSITGSGTKQYCKNGSNSSCAGSTWTTFATGDTITVASTDTLRFKLASGGTHSIMSGEVIDDTTLAHVGYVDVGLDE